MFWNPKFRIGKRKGEERGFFECNSDLRGWSARVYVYFGGIFKFFYWWGRGGGCTSIGGETDYGGQNAL